MTNYDQLYEILGDHYLEVSTDGVQTIRSKDYNSTFNFKTGYTERYGRTVDDDVTAPVPEIVDIEVTTICAGVSDASGVKIPCKCCYKSNGPCGDNMSFELFKTIYDKLPECVHQIAFSADSDLLANPEIFDMMRYCRENGRNTTVPSISVADLGMAEAQKLMESGVGTVGVSLYANKETCYDTVDRLSRAVEASKYPAVLQIQCVVAEDTYGQIMELLDDLETDPRLARVECVTYLAMKHKGRGEGFKLLSPDGWRNILRKTEASRLDRFGVDVCSTKKLVVFYGEDPELNRVSQPCDAGFYNVCVNVRGEAFPCSFLEGSEGWETGEDLVSQSFNQAWFSERFVEHRRKLLEVNKPECDKSCILWEV